MAQRLQQRKQAKKQSGPVGAVIQFFIFLYIGIQFVASGIIASLDIGVIGIPFLLVGIVLIVSGVLAFVRGLKKNAAKSETDVVRRQPAPPRPTEKTNFSFRGDHHQHIVVTGISVEKQLEQLETLYHAGMYTKEQYLLEKQKIKSRA